MKCQDLFSLKKIIKISIDIACESSAKQMIHMKCQDLFSLKNNKRKIRMMQLLILFGALKG